MQKMFSTHMLRRKKGATKVLDSRKTSMGTIEEALPGL
jgi:hypothetical protein